MSESLFHLGLKAKGKGIPSKIAEALASLGIAPRYITFNEPKGIHVVSFQNKATRNNLVLSARSISIDGKPTPLSFFPPHSTLRCQFDIETPLLEIEKALNDNPLISAFTFGKVKGFPSIFDGSVTTFCLSSNPASRVEVPGRSPLLFKERKPPPSRTQTNSSTSDAPPPPKTSAPVQETPSRPPNVRKDTVADREANSPHATKAPVAPVPSLIESQISFGDFTPNSFPYTPSSTEIFSPPSTPTNHPSSTDSNTRKRSRSLPSPSSPPVQPKSPTKMPRGSPQLQSPAIPAKIRSPPCLFSLPAKGPPPSSDPTGSEAPRSD